MATPKLVTVVRPYGPRIRTRVFELMQSAGCDIQTEHVIARGTSDADAVKVVLANNTPVLLVPFHGHNDANGRRLDGLQFLRELDRATPQKFEWRIIMPVSAFAIPAVNSMLGRGSVSQRVRERLLLIMEDELDNPKVADRIRAHVNGEAWP